MYLKGLNVQGRIALVSDRCRVTAGSAVIFGIPTCPDPGSMSFSLCIVVNIKSRVFNLCAKIFSFCSHIRSTSQKDVHCMSDFYDKKLPYGMRTIGSVVCWNRRWRWDVSSFYVRFQQTFRRNSNWA